MSSVLLPVSCPVRKYLILEFVMLQTNACVVRVDGPSLRGKRAPTNLKTQFAQFQSVKHA
jgi:hypothetical protein